MIQLPHLETNVTIACQHRCVACNHFVPIQVRDFKASMVRPEMLARDLAIFSTIVRVHGYALIGGEPLLHPEIVTLMEIANESGIADRVEVWTNGAALREMGDDFWKAADVLVVSAYPGKLDDDELGWIGAACQESGTTLIVKDERTVPNFSRLLEPKPTTGEALQRKYDHCFFKSYSRVLDHGYFFRCCTSPFIPKLLLDQPFGTDGIAIEGLTEAGLQAFLDLSEPMVSCGICAGRAGRGQPIAWREVKDPNEWLRASAGPA